MSKLSVGENEKKQRIIMTNKNTFKQKLLCLMSAVLFVTLLILPVSAVQSKEAGREYIVGGELFGITLQTDGVLVVGLDKVETAAGAFCPAYDAGIKLGDVVTEINGEKISSAEKVTEIASKNGSGELSLKVKRKQSEKNLTVRPAKGTDGKYYLGITVRDSAAGIGTVTYIDPSTGEFGGLGHGICDGITGVLMPVSRGAVLDVKLSGIVRGQSGVPGEIKGIFGAGKKGALVLNSDTGVYGVFSGYPSQSQLKLKTATIDEVSTGEATIRCSVTGEVGEYTVKITRINKNISGGKNFSIEVTDAKLLAITGGIVQGMSGSPIIQNGKLIGAVTHVTVNDPKCGYGIAIENMLR